MLDHLTYLLGLFEARDWTAVETFVRSNPEMYCCISNRICEYEEFNGMTLLHACVRFDPPTSVLLKVIHLHPEALRKEDCIGRTPLHVAAGSGASFFVMKVLTAMYPGACAIQDEGGRTPLHIACDSSCELFEGECSSRGPPSLDTVLVLLAGSLDAATLEDAEEMNAVEHAILSNAPIDVVVTLQKAMRRAMEMKKSKMVSSPRSSPGSTVMSNIQELKI
ncbi:hypothetical protein ACHAW5_008196 [Stephanodiscus triporus]|uniref:Ankyrin repeat protein n=1 Tax=Stephanodiscus triporus TaxID=2934178 RepID=A0ABD3MQH4_9STRA